MVKTGLRKNTSPYGGGRPVLNEEVLNRESPSNVVKKLAGSVFNIMR